MNYNDSIFIFDSINCSVDSLRARIDAFQTKTDVLYNIVETSNDSISNQLASATLWLEVIAILIVITGGVVGLYISYKKRQIEEISETVEEKKLLIEKMAKDTEILDAKIHKNLTELYKDLRKEETKALMERLVLEPLDISNLIKPLLARDLDEGNYELLRKAYLTFLDMAKNSDCSTDDIKDKKKNEYKIEGNYNTENFSYLILFFQHYIYQSVKDDSIRPYILTEMTDIVNCAFKRDIVKSTIQLCTALKEETSSFNKEEVLTTFLKGINESKHNEYIDLKNILEQNIIPKTILENAIEKCKEENVYIKLFGIVPPEEKKK